MKPFVVAFNKNFVGRERERSILERVKKRKEASVVIVYGRRRVGKTELIEQSFRTRNILKFEGIERPRSSRKKIEREYQISHVLEQLALYSETPHIARLKLTRWSEVFNLLADFTSQGEWTLYFEEVQWLANYNSDFFAELKNIWDNRFQRNPKLILVLCGSSPSFIMSQLLSNKAFYNRAQEEIHLQPFNLIETQLFFGRNRSPWETMLATLTCGGIPEYLKKLKSGPSVLISLGENSFLPDSFFSKEKDRIFVSSLSHTPHFEKIVDILSQRKYATRDELLKWLHLDSGGRLSALLEELEMCGFIEAYTPVHLENSILTRYGIADPYLRTYFKFIAHRHKRIQNGDFEKNPLSGFDQKGFETWLGFSFEHFCRRNHLLIAKILGFESVDYRSGAFFGREHQKEGFQIDLAYIRKDFVITICEIKYQKEPVSDSVIKEVEKKIAVLKEFYPQIHRYTIQHVLISAAGAQKNVEQSGFFYKVVKLKDLFEKSAWR